MGDASGLSLSANLIVGHHLVDHADLLERLRHHAHVLANFFADDVAAELRANAQEAGGDLEVEDVWILDVVSCLLDVGEGEVLLLFRLGEVVALKPKEDLAERVGLDVGAGDEEFARVPQLAGGVGG